jgi:Holliday junction DNA helicase RuvA
VSLIAAIEGILEAKTGEGALVRVGGVTFSVSVPANDLAAMPGTGSVVRLVTHLTVREDDLLLYGFADERGRALFESLLGISGIGPKAALAVLSVMSAGELASAIVAGDAVAITRAPGVGRKTAERIILELKGKLEDELGGFPAAVVASGGTGVDPALSLLLELGFSPLEARQALSVDQGEEIDMDERVRRALQHMGGAHD